MVLDLATALALAASCAPQVAPLTLLSIVQVESGFESLAIGVNRSDAPRPRPHSVDEAVREAHRLIASGHDVDLGLAQINVRNLRRLGMDVADAFDPCRNLQASAQILQAGYRTPSYDPQAALRQALSRYNTGHPARGLANGYVDRVTQAALRIAPQLAARPLAPATSRPAEAPPAQAWDPFARAKTTARIQATFSPGVVP